MTETRADSFWSFTLAFYGRAGVSGALIALQDRFGHDVNLLLYACWLGLHEGVALTEAERAAAAARVEEWRRMVLLPLRAARRAIKAAALPQTEAIYADAKSIELEAEQIAQRLMASAAPAARAGTALDERRRVAAANLDLCLPSEEERTLATPVRTALAAIVAP
jgi:uncharacterized protein (TIGR02444 family)